MRVMDFYLHHEGLIRENWVPLDILDLLQQMGVDVIGRMQSHSGAAAEPRAENRLTWTRFQSRTRSRG